MKSFLVFPPADLAEFISKINIVECEPGDALRHEMLIYADGRPGMVFHTAAQGLVDPKGTCSLPTFCLYGQTIKPIKVDAYAAFRMIIIHFHSFALKSIFKMDAHELADAVIDLQVVHLPSFRLCRRFTAVIRSFLKCKQYK